jgi:hypothetical protein
VGVTKAKCPLEWALQKQNAHSNGHYKRKMPTQVGVLFSEMHSHLRRSDVPSSYPEKILPVIEEED